VWRCDLICGKPDAASAAPGPCEDNALETPDCLADGANAAYCKFGDSMNAKTDRGAAKPLASQEPVFRLPLVAPSFDRPIFVDSFAGMLCALGPVVVISSAASPPVSEGGSTMMILEAIVSSCSLAGSASLERRLRSGTESNRPACRLGRLGRRLLSRHRYAP
jgi:hypothetical protein